MSSVPPGGRQDFTPPVRRLRTDDASRVDTLSELARALKNQRPANDTDTLQDRPEPPPAPFVSAGLAARTVVEDTAAKRLAAFEKELNRNRLNDIAALARSLTYGEMIELADAVFGCAPQDGITRENLSAVIHRWAMQEPDRAKTARQKIQEALEEARAGHRVEPREAGRDPEADIGASEGSR